MYHIAVSNVHESAVPVTRVEEMSTSNSLSLQFYTRHGLNRTSSLEEPGNLDALLKIVLKHGSIRISCLSPPNSHIILPWNFSCEIFRQA